MACFFVVVCEQGVPEAESRMRPVRVEAARGADSCVAAAVRGGHLRVLRLLLAAGASPDGTAQPPHKVAHCSLSLYGSTSFSLSYLLY